MRQVYFPFLLFIVVLLSAGCKTTQLNSSIKQIKAGTYDGTIGDQKVVVKIEQESNSILSAFFIPVRKNAMEKRNFFHLEQKKKRLKLTTNNYTSNARLKVDGSNINGAILLPRKTNKNYQFSRISKIDLTLRKEQSIPIVNNRYIEPVFSSWDEIDNILYGKAKGYWTRNADLTKPYISIIASGLFKMITGEDELELKLDFYEPFGDTITQRPLVLLIHGGAFYIGYKECNTITKFAHDLAKRGYAVATIDYRMGFKTTAEDVERSGYKATQDAHAALRYLVHNTSFFKFSKENIYTVGTSAGAITALNLAFLDEDERPKSTIGKTKNDDLGPINSSGNAHRDSFNIAGVVNMWGAVSDTSIIDDDEKIPVLSIHGDKDQIVPFSFDYPFNLLPLGINKLMLNKVFGSSMIQKRLNSLGIKNDFLTLSKADHEPIVDEDQNFTPLFDTVRNETYQFLGSLSAPQIISDNSYPTFLTQNKISAYKPLVTNGTTLLVNPVGGISIDQRATNPQVIWFDDSAKYEIEVYAKNNLGSVVKKVIPISAPILKK